MTKIVGSAMVGSDMLDVHLTNGHILLLDCQKILTLSKFAVNMDLDKIRKLRYDEGQLFWETGQNLTLAEIFSLVTSEDGMGSNLGDCQ